MNQMDKTTVLSLDPDIVEASISAMKRRRSVCTAGPLNKAVSKLSPSTSKLLLINVGGAIEIADSFLMVTYKNPQNPAHKTLAQLAKACDKTGIQFVTDERINDLKVSLSLEQLPALDNLFPMLMQLSQIDPTAKVIATKAQPHNGATVGLSSVSKLEWKSGANAKSHRIYFGTQADLLPLLSEVQKSSHDELPELEEGIRYYWRIDEVWADGTVITGDVWSFTIGKLVGLWKLDGDAKDSSGNGNDGTVNGDPSWVDGRIGGALKLDGVDDYVDTGYKANLPVWTVAVWVNSPAAPKPVSPSGPVHREKNYQFNWNHSMGDFRGAAGVQIGGSWHGASFGQLKAGTWYHLAATYDGENLKAYKDGDLITNNSGPSGVPDAENETLKLGRHAASTDYFGGTIDDVRIYNYALNEKEIETLCRVKAVKPDPSEGAIIGMTEKPKLSWIPAIGTTSNKIYGGVEPDKLKLLGETTESNSFELPDMQNNIKYYWRVDGILSDGSIAKGDVWTLSIGRLVGWWKFDGNANDSSGNGNNGTEIGNPIYVAGKISQAISFDGDGDRIEVPATITVNPELFSSMAISASAWVRTTVSAESLCSLVRHEFHFTPLQTFAGGAHAAAFTDQNGSRELHLTTFDWNKINDGKWHHCTVTYNNGIHEVWIDGTKEVSENLGPFPLWTGDNQPWVFGGKERGEGGGEYYPGELDDVRIYNYSLSKEEIIALYNEGKQ
jgi:hypothetical protein